LERAGLRAHLIVFSLLSFSFSLLLLTPVLVLAPEETAVWWSELNKQEGDAKGRTDSKAWSNAPLNGQRRAPGWTTRRERRRGGAEYHTSTEREEERKETRREKKKELRQS
jgi:hypothetical protein